MAQRTVSSVFGASCHGGEADGLDVGAWRQRPERWVGNEPRHQEAHAHGRYRELGDDRPHHASVAAHDEIAESSCEAEPAPLEDDAEGDANEPVGAEFELLRAEVDAEARDSEKSSERGVGHAGAGELGRRGIRLRLHRHPRLKLSKWNKIQAKSRCAPGRAKPGGNVEGLPGG
jgi:hypothetical protein